MAHEEITARFIRERMRFENAGADDVIIADAFANSTINAQITIKGPAELDELREGQSYRFFGKWVDYKNKRTNQSEKQFAFQTFARETPATPEAIVSYLTQHGEGHGLGKARANKLFQALGNDAVETARTNPAKVVETLKAVGLKLSLENAELIAEELKKDESTEKTKLELCGLLSNRGFPKNVAHLAIQRWGNHAPRMLSRDPYRLMEIKGCGFKKCDSMYLDLGLNPTRLKRQALAAWYSIARDSEGHTWYLEAVPKAFIKATITGANVDIPRALSLAVRAKMLDRRSEGHKVWYSEAKKSQNEGFISSTVVRSIAEPIMWPSADSVAGITPHQKNELSKSLVSPVCVLGGSPGTGKTWTVASLVARLAETVGLDNIAIGAPTGKAAVRVTENLSARNIPLRASTWHSMLMRCKEEGFFGAKILIGDESSMIDTDLMAAIMRHRAAGSHLLLVGDVHQLPPVGHGAPLRDMIASGVAFGDLRQIMRNSGGIVETCAAIRDENPWDAGDNLLIDTAGRPEFQIKRILERLEEAKRDKLDPVWDVQTVVAVNERSPLSRKELNKILQAELNNHPGQSGVPFRMNDKIVNGKNNFFDMVASPDDEVVLNARNQCYVANGELAKVIEIDRNGFVAELTSPNRLIKVRMIREAGDDSESEGSNAGCTFELGYALSVHKSQGSDWPRVLVALDEYPGARMVCDRSWLYTAISRGKEQVVLIGKKETADRMCQVSNIWRRKTFLKESIQHTKCLELLANV